MSDLDDSMVLQTWFGAAERLLVLEATLELEFSESTSHPFPAALLRGALGNALRLRHCPSQGATCCPAAEGCPYCELFGRQPAERAAGWTKGQIAVPQPFSVIVEPAAWSRGQVRLVYVGRAVRHADVVVDSLRHVGARGAGSRRLQWIVLRPGGDAGRGIPAAVSLRRAVLEIIDPLERTQAIRIAAESPLRLKRKGVWVKTPDLRSIAVAASRRFSALALHFGDGTMCPAPPEQLLQACERATTIQREWRWVERRRRSSRQSRMQILSGALGHCIVPKPSAELLWLLAVAAVIGIGKGTTFGFGALRLGPA